MTNWIKTSLAAAVAATVGLGAGTAMARGAGDCDGPRGKPHAMEQRMDPGAMHERTERGLTRLQEALGLQPAQMGAWDAFRGAMLSRAQTAAERMHEMRGQERPATALERIARMETVGKERVAALGDTRRVVETFYAQLSDAQKRTFDEQYRPFGHGGRGHGGKGPGHMGPGGTS